MATRSRIVAVLSSEVLSQSEGGTVLNGRLSRILDRKIVLPMCPPGRVQCSCCRSDGRPATTRLDGRPAGPRGWLVYRSVVPAIAGVQFTVGCDVAAVVKSHILPCTLQASLVTVTTLAPVPRCPGFSRRSVWCDVNLAGTSFAATSRSSPLF